MKHSQQVFAVCRSRNFLIERNGDVTLSTCLCELFPRLARMGREELSWFNTARSLMLSASDTDERRREREGERGGLFGEGGVKMSASETPARLHYGAGRREKKSALHRSGSPISRSVQAANQPIYQPAGTQGFPLTLCPSRGFDWRVERRSCVTAN